jgi:WD40 repeat protein/serine/threonine protein kinase
MNGLKRPFYVLNANQLMRPMSLKDDSNSETFSEQALQSLLKLDEKLRTGEQSDVASHAESLILSDVEKNLLRLGTEALQKLEAAIPRRSQKMPSWAPRSIGRFELRSVLGAGGFAVVYLAHDPKLGRPVALKVPRPHALIQPELRHRFVTEARAAARLDHPHIVPVFEAGEDGDLPYIACALCEGPSLAEWLSGRTTPLNPRITAQVMRQLADALQYSHDRGILHRDIKPGNVLLFPQTRASVEEFPFVARVGDFGLAKLLEDPGLDSVTSQLIGTPRFMAPEMLGDGVRTASVAADVYALGAVLYAMLTGQAPFGSASLVETMTSIATEDPAAPELLNRSVSRDLSLICLKCLEKSPEARYQSAAELRDDLDRFLNGQCVMARQTPVAVRLKKWSRRHPVIAALSVVSTLFLLSIVMMVVRYTSSLKGLQGQLQESNSILQRQVRQLDVALKSAESSQQEAADQRGHVTQLLKIADINHAGRIWRQGDTKGAVRLLEPWVRQLSNNPAAPTSADVALRYLWNRVTVDAALLTQSEQSVWWMHHDAGSDQVLLAGSRGQLELVSSREDSPQASNAVTAVNVSSGELSSVTLSDDRKLAATSGDDGKVRIWNVDSSDGLTSQSFKLAHEIPVLPDASVYGVLFLRGAHHLISCAREPTLKVWDGETGLLIREVATAHPRFIESVVISPDGTQLATVGADGLIEVFCLPELTSTRQIYASEKPLSMAAFSNDGQLLACGGWDKLLRLYDLESGRQISNYKSMAGIYCVTCNQQNEVLVGDRDGALTLFRIPSTLEIPATDEPVLQWRPEKRWPGHDAPVSSICWAKDASQVTASAISSVEPSGRWISADRHGKIKAWDIAESESTVLKLGPSPGTPVIPVVHVFEEHLLRGTETEIQIIDRKNGVVTSTLPTPAKTTSLAVMAASGTIVAGDADGNLHWFRKTNRGIEPAGEMPVLRGSAVIRLHVSDDGRFACAINKDWKMVVVDGPAKTIRLQLENAPGAFVHPDGEQLLRTFGNNDELQVIRLSDGSVVATLKGHRSTVSRVAFTADGRTCISASHDRTICLWDTQSWTLKQQLTGHESPISALAISPRGDLAVTGDDSGTLRLWDVQSGRELTELDERVNQIVGLAFDKNGASLVAWDVSQRVYQIEL